jgi:hypothetical protein
MLPAAVHTHRVAHMDAEEADERRRRILARQRFLAIDGAAEPLG